MAPQNESEIKQTFTIKTFLCGHLASSMSSFGLYRHLSVLQRERNVHVRFWTHILHIWRKGTISSGTQTTCKNIQTDSEI